MPKINTSSVKICESSRPRLAQKFSIVTRTIVHAKFSHNRPSCITAIHPIHTASPVESQTAGSLFGFPAISVPSTFLRALRNLMHGVEFRSVPGLCATSHSGINSTAGCVICSAPTHHMTKVRPPIDSPHRGLVSRLTPEYQCLWFQFIRSHFYCMAIAAECHPHPACRRPRTAR
jgi:hypothetical protein